MSKNTLKEDTALASIGDTELASKRLAIGNALLVMAVVTGYALVTVSVNNDKEIPLITGVVQFMAPFSVAIGAFALLIRRTAKLDLENINSILDQYYSTHSYEK